MYLVIEQLGKLHYSNITAKCIQNQSGYSFNKCIVQKVFES